MRRASSIFVLVGLASSNAYIQRLHTQFRMIQEVIGTRLQDRACAVKMRRRAAADCLRNMHSAYRRVAHVYMREMWNKVRVMEAVVRDPRFRGQAGGIAELSALFLNDVHRACKMLSFE
jgi:hypothetical protein